MKKTQQRAIPLSQRFQTGKVTKAIDVTALHVKFEHCRWAKSARIRQKELPKSKALTDYREGEEVEVFLLNQSKDDPDFFQASLRWANPDNNPWITEVPVPGKLHEVKAIRYLPNMSGVFVRLPNGIESLLWVNEIPGDDQNISTCIDIGDELIVEIIQVHEPLLQASSSILQALKRLWANEKHRRLKEFTQGMMRVIPRNNWSLPSKSLTLALLANRYFSLELAAWLNSFGIETRLLDDTNHLVRILSAPNPLCLSTSNDKIEDKIQFRQQLGRFYNSPDGTIDFLNYLKNTYNREDYDRLMGAEIDYLHAIIKHYEKFPSDNQENNKNIIRLATDILKK